MGGINRWFASTRDCKGGMRRLASGFAIARPPHLRTVATLQFARAASRDCTSRSACVCVCLSLSIYLSPSLPLQGVNHVDPISFREDGKTMLCGARQCNAARRDCSRLIPRYPGFRDHELTAERISDNARARFAAALPLSLPPILALSLPFSLPLSVSSSSLPPLRLRWFLRYYL